MHTTNNYEVEGTTKVPRHQVRDEMNNHRFGHILLDRRRSTNVAFRDIVYTVSVNGEKEQILKGVSGEFRPGLLTAIMGPSGAGKSTLMNVIAGLIKTNVKGEVLINSAKRVLKKFRKISCYIMQEDELCPLLTVTETMELAANLKLGNSLSAEKKTTLICEILETIGMADTKDTRAANLSSGERKRLAIALELVNNPPILFLDEPTSRLDSSSCIQFVSLLRSLARSGRTVICVIHQPSSSVFEMFDQLYMMAEGRCIYQGPTFGLVGFLSTSVGLDCPEDHNPADFVMDVAVGNYGNMVEKLVEANNQNQLTRAVPSRTPKSVVYNDDDGLTTHRETKLSILPDELDKLCFTSDSNDFYCDNRKISFWAQFVLLCKRSLMCSLRDKTLIHLRIVIQIFLATMLGVIYFGIGNDASKSFDNVSLLFINQMVFMFTAMIATCLTFPLELPVVLRENLNNWYTVKAYYLAKSVVDLPVEVINSVLYAVIVYFMTNQPYEVERFFVYFSIGLMNSLVAQSIGLTLGAAFDLSTSVLASAVIMNFCVLVGGLVTANAAPIYLRWTLYTTYFRYCYRASMVAIYGFGREKLDCSLAYCIFKMPETILEGYDVDVGIPFWVDMVVLVSYFFLVRFLGYFLLVRTIRLAKI